MIQARQGQTTGNSRWRAILLGAATMLLGQVATAELSLRMELAQTMLHRFERIHMIVTVSNMGSRVIMLDPQRREGNGYLDFDVRQMDENMPRMVALSPVPASGAIAPGTSRRFLIDLAQVGNMGGIGGYNVQPYVVWNGQRYETRITHINVVGGLPLKSVTRASPLAPEARRTYSLSYLARKGSEELFLSVEEEATSLNYGVFSLGPLVRVFTPVLEVDGDGGVTVVHQMSPSQFVRSLLQSTAGGVRLIDQSYEELRGRIGASGSWENLQSGPAETQEPSKKSSKKK